MLNGILNILKPPGMSSHDVVGFVRRTLSIKKVGHAGTLDPDAAGVLPVFVGNATRLIEYTADADKNYRVHLKFGIKTDTGDDSGKIIATSAILPVDNEFLATALQSFEGAQQQVPPMYSALKLNGQKLYQLARKGIEVERASREIFIHSLKLVNSYNEGLLLDVTCSKGTYVRTLVEDLAENLGMLATMTFLVRTRVASFTIAEACTLEELAEHKHSLLLPAEQAIAHLPILKVTPNQARRFTQGVTTTYRDIDTEFAQDSLVAIFADSEELLGIGLVRGEQIKPRKVFPTAQNN